jgi:acetyl esterase/lipase
MFILLRRSALCLMTLLITVDSVSSQEKPSTANSSDVRSFRERVTETLDIEYGRVDDRPLLLDLYEPKAKANKTLPCVVWIHGGGWKGGSKSSGRQQIGSYAASGHYIAVSVEYRFSDVAKWPAQIYDCKAAIRFLRANAVRFGIDPDRIGVWGGSAGGHLVSLLGTSGDVPELEGELGNAGTSSRVQCVVDYCGPSDFMDFAKGAPKEFHETGPVFQLFGGPIDSHRKSAVAASPITHVSKDDPPFLIVHGSEDPLVPQRQADLFHQAQVQAGMDTTKIIIEGGGHGIGGDQIARRVRLFFDKHLLNHDVVISDEAIIAGNRR